MGKYLASLILSLFTLGCTTSQPTIQPTSLSSEWNTGMAVYGVNRVVATYKPTDVPRVTSDKKTNVGIEFSPVAYSNNRPMACRNTPNSNRSVIKVNFSFEYKDAKNNEYTFDNSKVWLTKKNGAKFNLSPVDYYSNISRSAGIYDLNGPITPKNDGSGEFHNPGVHYFKSTLICEELEGAIFELRGLYRNGQELPPIKFRINYINPSHQGI